MITVKGTARLVVRYSVEVDKTVAEWDSLSEKQQNEIIDSTIDWVSACRNGDLDEIDVDDVLVDGVPA